MIRSTVWPIGWRPRPRRARPWNRRCAPPPDRLASPALLAAAAGLAMAERHGAPVVDVLDGLVSALRDAARSAAAVQTALAAPRATATLLGVLPLAGIALGELVGVDPVSVLVGAPLGRVALVLGLAATWSGRVWMRRLVRQVERP